MTISETKRPAAAPSKPIAEKPASLVATAPSSTISATRSSVVNLMTNPAFKGFDDLTTFGQANINALIQTNTVLAKGVEEFSREIASLAHASLETGAAAAKAAFAAKTVPEMMAAQTDFAKASIEKMLANWARFGELGMKLATETASPLAERANAMAALVGQPAA